MERYEIDDYIDDINKCTCYSDYAKINEKVKELERYYSKILNSERSDVMNFKDKSLSSLNALIIPIFEYSSVMSYNSALFKNCPETILFKEIELPKAGEIVVNSKAEFIENLEIFSVKILSNMNWENVLMVGKIKIK